MEAVTAVEAVEAVEAVVIESPLEFRPVPATRQALLHWVPLSFLLSVWLVVSYLGRQALLHLRLQALQELRSFNLRQ